MNDEKRYSAREVNKILRSLLEKNRRKQLVGGGYTRSDINATAKDLGIPQQQLDKALADQEIRRYRRKRYIKKYSVLALIGIAVVGFLAFLFWPVYFTGTVKITLTSDVTEEFSPKDDLEHFSLFYHDKVFCFVTIYDIHSEHNVKCIFYDAEQEQVSKSTLLLTGVDDTHYAYFTYDLLLSSQPGKWRVEIYVDDALQAEKEFTIELGVYKVTLTSDMDENDDPVDSLTTFSKAGHERIYCFIDWPKIRGEHLIEWNWIDPDGKLDSTDSLTIIQEGGSHWAYDSMQTKNKPAGQWMVELIMDSFQFGTKEFTLTE
jgi:hypothetical protein